MPSFVTEAEVEAWLRDADADPALTALLIPAASEAVESYCQREFTPVTEEREFFYNGSGVLSFAPGEIRSLTSITFAQEAETLSYAPLVKPSYGLRGKTKQGTYLWLALPRLQAPSFDPLPGPAVGWTVKINGSWGTAAVPNAVKMATLIVIENQLTNPAGAAGVQDEVGGISYSETEGQPSPHIPDDAKGWLEGLARNSGVGV